MRANFQLKRESLNFLSSVWGNLKSNLRLLWLLILISVCMPSRTATKILPSCQQKCYGWNFNHNKNSISLKFQLSKIKFPLYLLTLTTSRPMEINLPTDFSRTKLNYDFCLMWQLWHATVCSSRLLLCTVFTLIAHALSLLNRGCCD